MDAIALWAILSALAWASGSGVLSSHSISDLRQVRAFAIDVAVQALIIGTLLGIGGAVILRRFLRKPLLWALGGLAAVPAGLTLGFLLDAMFLYRQVHSMGMALSGEGGGAFMSTSPPMQLVFGGLVLGLFLSPSLATGLAGRPVTKVFWVAGIAASLGIAWFVSAALTNGSPAPGLAHGVLMGLASGALIGGLLLTMESDVRRLTTRWSRPGTVAPKWRRG